MNENESVIQIDERVQDFYRLAKEYDAVDPLDVNPSLHGLCQVSQRYQSAELIAEGGMKRIFKVYDARAKRHLAMAMLRDDAREELCDPFIHEAWLTAQLMHPNIITIHDVGVNSSGWPYFTMDLREGNSLRELIEMLSKGDREFLNRYPLEELLQIFVKICDAVSYAHSVGVLHLDLKPANVQIGEYGQVMVCDWGMGKVIGDKKSGLELDRELLNPDLLSSITYYGELKGTPGNMAPEQVQKDGKLDEQTDIYGLGSILYSLLTLRPPLSGDTNEILQHTLNGNIIPPIKRAPDRHIPTALNAVVLRAMALSPSARYKSVVELRIEVNRFLSGYATEAEHAGVGKQFMLLYKRNRLLCNVVICFLLLLAGGGGVAFFRVSRARDIAERSLALYTAGQSELAMVNEENVYSITQLARHRLASGEVERAQTILEQALAQDPDNPVLTKEMAILYFTQQQFEKSVFYLEQGGQFGGKLHTLAKKTAEIKPDSVRLLTVEQMTNLLTQMQGISPSLQLMITGDHRQRFDLTERARIIECYMRLTNPEWTEGWFDYDLESNRLRIGGDGLHTLPPFLSALNLRELDLSGSDVSYLWNLKSLAIERLNIHNTPVSEVWPIKRFVYLRELVMDKGQLPNGQLKQLPKQVKITEIE